MRFGRLTVNELYFRYIQDQQLSGLPQVTDILHHIMFFRVQLYMIGIRTHIICLVYLMLPVFLDCPFVIARSVSFNVYSQSQQGQALIAQVVVIPTVKRSRTRRLLCFDRLACQSYQLCNFQFCQSKPYLFSRVLKFTIFVKL